METPRRHTVRPYGQFHGRRVTATIEIDCAGIPVPMEADNRWRRFRLWTIAAWREPIALS